MFIEDKVTDITNQSADVCFRRNEVFGGPTAIDYSMLEHTGPSPNEKKLMDKWKKQDLSAYYKQQRNNYYR